MNPLIEKYKDYSDERLLEIIYHKVDYKSEAVEAAQYWVTERKVSKQKKEEVETHFRQKAAAQAQAAAEPLQAWEQILFLLIPFVGLVTFLIAQVKYAEQGKSKKSSDAGLYTLIGAALWGITIWAIAG